MYVNKAKNKMLHTLHYIVKKCFKLFRKYLVHLHSSKMRRNKMEDVQTLWQNVTSKVLATAVFILVANPLGVAEKAQGMQPCTFMLTTSYPTSSSLPIPICRFFGQNVNPKSFSILTNEDHQSRVSIGSLSISLCNLGSDGLWSF